MPMRASDALLPCLPPVLSAACSLALIPRVWRHWPRRWLREGFALFGAGPKKRSDWARRTLERFPFHPSRTEKSLSQKWQNQKGK